MTIQHPPLECLTRMFGSRLLRTDSTRDKRPVRPILWFVLGAVATFVPVIFARGAEPSPTSQTVQAGELGRQVNPFVGTGGVSYLCGREFPGATVPFGMVRLSPDTVSSSGRRATNTSGYYYRDPKLLGFSHTRLAGTGATDGGNFLVIPL